MAEVKLSRFQIVLFRNFSQVAGMGGKIGSLGAAFTTSLVNFIDLETRQKLTTVSCATFVGDRGV
jgi:hypothetical protein